MSTVALAPYAFAHIALFYAHRAMVADAVRVAARLPFRWTSDDEASSQYLQQSSPLEVPATWFRRR